MEIKNRQWFVCFMAEVGVDIGVPKTPVIGRVKSENPWAVEDDRCEAWDYPRADFERDVTDGIVVLLTPPRSP